MQNIKALGLLVSEKKNFENGLLCSYFLNCLNCDSPQGGASFDPGDKLGRGLQGDAIDHI